MDAKLAEQIAQSLDGSSAELLPYLPELLGALDELGVAADDALEMLEAAHLPAQADVLDLGCGKGVTAVALAKSLGCRVRGVDGMPVFIEAARQRAQLQGVDGQCEFDVEDIKQELQKPGQFDLVMMLSIGPILGDMEATIGALRQKVRSGGYLLIDDGYLRSDDDDGVVDYEGYAGHTETIRRMTAFGDRIVAESVDTPDEAHEVNSAQLALIRSAAESLSLKHPHLESLFAGYVASQQEAGLALEGPIVGATWLIQRV